ncbi:MAG: TetR/AcrR family transcriptional regulator [Phycisphaeraceae bacterium]
MVKKKHEFFSIGPIEPRGRVKEPAIPTSAVSIPKLRRRWRDADHQERRRLIVDVAVHILNKDGVDAVTIRRVAAALGVGAMTLYTYVNGQDGLRLAMTQHGFDLLAGGCREANTLGTPQGWRGSAKHYLQFALTYPNLYKLMFATEVASGDAEEQILHRGFQGLLERVKDEMTAKGHPKEVIDRSLQMTAGRYWIALHGLASLAIAGKLGVLNADLDALLDSLLERVAPT